MRPILAPTIRRGVSVNTTTDVATIHRGVGIDAECTQVDAGGPPGVDGAFKRSDVQPRDGVGGAGTHLVLALSKTNVHISNRPIHREAEMLGRVGQFDNAPIATQWP